MSTTTELRKAGEAGDDVAFQAIVDRRRAARMAEIDRMPTDLRSCVHDYGYAVVKTFLDFGVRKPKQIRHAVETVLNEFSPTRGSYARQGIRTAVGAHPAAAALDEGNQSPAKGSGGQRG